MPWPPSCAAHASLPAPHILLPLQKKPPAYGTEGTFDPISNLADGNIDTLLPFGNLLAPGSLVHDATFELHLSERLPVLSQILAFVGIDGRPLWEAGFLQGRFKMLDAALVGSRCLLGQDQSILVCYRMTLVAKVELFHLLVPSGILVHIGFDNFLEHCFLQGFSAVLLMTVFHHLIFPTPTGTMGSVYNTCLYNGIVPDDNVFLFEFMVYFIENHIVQAGLYQCVPKTADGRAVGNSIFHAQTDETVEREAIVHLLLNFTVTQSILCMQKFGLE